MRVSERQRYHITNSRVGKARGQNAEVLERLSTLKDINRISDNPIAMGQSLRTKDRIGNMQQYQRNIDFSKGFLERTETAISGISENLMRAKELAIGQANSTYDADSRMAAAMELKQIINQVISEGNATYLDKFVFSGYRTKTPTLSDEGDYLGDDGALYLQINGNDFRQVNIKARYLFEPNAVDRELGHFNLIDSLKLFEDGLLSDDTSQIHKALTELDYQIEKSTSFQAELGSLYQALNSTGKSLEMDEEITRGELAKITEVDMFKASSDFHRTESILQSTLLASNKLLQPSLLNFLQ